MKIDLWKRLWKVVIKEKASASSKELLIKRKEMLTDFEHRINYKFKNRALLLTALIHSSFAKGYHGGEIADNERLEFLGDAILQSTVSDFLFRRFPEYDEGELSKARASMVNRYTLAMLGEESRLGSYLMVGKSVSKQGDFHTSSLVADALEALIGAIYLDGGYKSALTFVSETFSSLWEDVANQNLNPDYKSMLQEFLQKRLGATPKYEIIGEFGQSHEKCFEVELTCNSTRTRGVGKSKKSAEQEAAKNALTLLAPEELRE